MLLIHGRTCIRIFRIIGHCRLCHLHNHIPALFDCLAARVFVCNHNADRHLARLVRRKCRFKIITAAGFHVANVSILILAIHVSFHLNHHVVQGNLPCVVVVEANCYRHTLLHLFGNGKIINL